MGRFQITCKTHDDKKRVISVKLSSDETHKTEQIWKWIDEKKDSFYTKDDKGKEADVLTGTSKDGRKYITTSGDRSIENNLDELPNC